jgi:hypothetical protein
MLSLSYNSLPRQIIMSLEDDKQWSDLNFQDLQNMHDEGENYPDVRILRSIQPEGQWVPLSTQEGMNYDTASTPRFPARTNADVPSPVSWWKGISCDYQEFEEDEEHQ